MSTTPELVAALVEAQDALLDAVNAERAKLAAEALALRQERDEALALLAAFVRLSDAMAREWRDGDWRGVLTAVRGQTESIREFLAKVSR